jgi:hypothetical protein
MDAIIGELPLAAFVVGNLPLLAGDHLDFPIAISIQSPSALLLIIAGKAIEPVQFPPAIVELLDLNPLFLAPTRQVGELDVGDLPQRWDTSCKVEK